MDLTIYPDIPASTQLTVVSGAARGWTLAKIADATTLPAHTIETIARYYGAPDLATLARNAEYLRAMVAQDQEGNVATNVGHVLTGVHPTIQKLRSEAARLGLRDLVRRCNSITAQIDQLHIDLEAARTATAEETNERAAKLQRLLELKEAAATRGKLISSLEGELGRLTPSERARCRAWADDQGITVPSRGMVPRRIVDAWTEAGRP